MRRSSLVSNFNKLTFATLFSFNFSSKSLWAIQPSSIKIWVLQPTTFQDQPSQVSFLGMFRASTPPHNFLAAAFLLFIMSLFEFKRSKLGYFDSLMFAADLLPNSAVVYIVTLYFKHAQQFYISHFTYHLSYYMINDYC